METSKRIITQDEYMAALDYGRYLCQLPVDAQRTFVDMLKGAVVLANIRDQTAPAGQNDA